MGNAMWNLNDETASNRENSLVSRSNNAPDREQKSQYEFEQRVAKSWSVTAWCEMHVVVAVSGGADSVALLRAMHALKQTYGGAGSLIVGTLNHGIRGEDAADDVDWLRALCDELKLRLCVGIADVQSLSLKQGDGLEAAARAARYDFLRRTAESFGARFVATAHTANDQVETVLHRIVRGTGVAGLGGIQRSRSLSESVTLFRPLLDSSRSQVIGYLADLGQTYRTDRTNSDTRFTRNRIRHDLLPNLRERFNSEVDAAVLRLAAQATEAEEFIHSVAAGLIRSCVEIEWDCAVRLGNGDRLLATKISIDCRLLTAQPALLLCEVCKCAWRQSNWPLQAMGSREWHVLAAMISNAGSTQSANLPGNVLARRENAVLRLEITSSP
jgi:tRNA(Ile)-lysidine synthase